MLYIPTMTKLIYYRDGNKLKNYLLNNEYRCEDLTQEESPYKYQIIDEGEIDIINTEDSAIFKIVELDLGCCETIGQGDPDFKTIEFKDGKLIVNGELKYNYNDIFKSDLEDIKYIYDNTTNFIAKIKDRLKEDIEIKGGYLGENHYEYNKFVKENEIITNPFNIICNFHFLPNGDPEFDFCVDDFRIIRKDTIIKSIIVNMMIRIKNDVKNEIDNCNAFNYTPNNIWI